jgi:diguanylate cyclase (GGDEF)-like protein
VVGPLVQDRYSLAAIVLFAVALCSVPVPFPSALIVGAAALILYPMLQVAFGADSRSFEFDAIIGAAAIATAVLLMRRREVDRRRSFLDALRYEFAATELSLLNQQLIRLSNTDALTGLPNRRFFEAEAARLCSERGANSLGAIMIDIDNFKKFNDTAGHVAGDVCLRNVAQALSRSLPEERGRIARYGGEEFAAIIPGTTPDQLEKLCRELRDAVSTLKLPHPGWPGHYVSISAGLAWSNRVEWKEPSHFWNKRIEHFMPRKQPDAINSRGLGRI